MLLWVFVPSLVVVFLLGLLVGWVWGKESQ